MYSAKAKRRPKKTRVLGYSTLATVHEDMDKLLLPSWVPTTPRHAGTTQHGKMTADQYRTLFTINLPFTLSRLWGTKPRESLEYRMFENFMCLVSATKIAMMRTMTRERVAKYQFYIKRYVQTLLDTYPGLSLAPTHHICLHLGDLLEDFGPVHAWRCFPFERYNGMLQKIPTNGKYGTNLTPFMLSVAHHSY